MFVNNLEEDYKKFKKSEKTLGREGQWQLEMRNKQCEIEG